jgi:hypothetical protein
MVGRLLHLIDRELGATVALTNLLHWKQRVNKCSQPSLLCLRVLAFHLRRVIIIQRLMAGGKLSLEELQSC